MSPVAADLITVRSSEYALATGSVTEVYLYYHDPDDEELRCYSYDVGAESMSTVNVIGVPTNVPAAQVTPLNLSRGVSYGPNGELGIHWPDSNARQWLWRPQVGTIINKSFTSSGFGDSTMIYVNGYWHFVKSGTDVGGARLRRLNASYTGLEDVGPVIEYLGSAEYLFGAADENTYYAARGNVFDGYEGYGFPLDGGSPFGLTDDEATLLVGERARDPLSGSEMWTNSISSMCAVYDRETAGTSRLDRFPATEEWQSSLSQARNRCHHLSGHVLSLWHRTTTGSGATPEAEIIGHNALGAEEGETPAFRFMVPSDLASADSWPFAAAIKTVAS